MAKITLEQKLYTRRIRPPHPWLYSLLMLVVRILNLTVRTEFVFKARPSAESGPIVYIANHASRNDYLFTAPACYPKRLNYVVGYNEFFRFPLSIMLRIAQAIPKKNFTPDVYCLKQILSVIKQGGNICIMPEGMSSITGMAQQAMPGSGKLIKKLGVPVYYSKISGAYLTFTKHCLDQRTGKVRVVVDRMFSAEDLVRMSADEIEETMDRLLAHDDYIWNKREQVRFNGKGQMAKKLDTLLYLCPKCGSKYSMRCEGNTMSCAACQNTVEIDECYNLRAVGDSVCPGLVSDWTIMERRKAAEMVKAPGFCHTGRVKIGILPPYKYLFGDKTSQICGEGTLTLSIEGINYDGTLDGEPFSFNLPADSVPTYGMCTDISRFYTFVDGRFIEFYPEAGDVLLWFHLTEEMHRHKGGKWQNTPHRHTD